jgi:hypothetical protein
MAYRYIFYDDSNGWFATDEFTSMDCSKKTALNKVRNYVTSGTSFELGIHVANTEFIQELELLLDSLNLTMTVAPDSDPQAIDYLFNAVYGCLHGATKYAGYGGLIWAALRLFKPVPFLPFFQVGFLVGMVIGTFQGLKHTPWVLRVHYKPLFSLNGIVYKNENFLFFYLEPSKMKKG